MRHFRFATLLVRTTGRRPWRDRVTALAALRVVDGAIDAQLSSAVSFAGPRRARFEEWGAEDGPDQAPSFASLESPLRALLNDVPIVGPDVRLHLAHLSYELSRLDRPGLGNPALDLGALAELVLGLALGSRKPSLASLAERFSLTPHRPDDLAGQARLAARVALRLLARLDLARYPGVDALIEAADRSSPRPLLQPLNAETLPSEPGIYLLRDDRGTPLYVGKATDLRSRVATYLGHAVATPRHLDGLAEATAELEVQSAGSPLEAALLEARLIRELRPRYNVQRRVRRPRLFLRLHLSEPRPRLRQTEEVLDDGALYLGPFRSAAAAERARGLALNIFELRPSGKHEPLQSALLFLTGNREPAIEHLQARMRRAAQAGDTVQVDRLRELLRQAQAFSMHEAALSMRPHADTFLAFCGHEAYLVHAARLVARVEAPDLETARAALAPTLATLGRHAPATLDEERYLVLRWLSSRGPEWQVVRVQV